MRRATEPAPSGAGPAAATLVLGILSLIPVIGLVPGVLGIVVGRSALKRCPPEHRWMALTGLGISVVTVVLWLWLLAQLATWDFDPFRSINEGL